MHLAATGHRPARLLGYSPDAHLRLTEFAQRALSQHQPDSVISGMALGWDLAIAQATLNLNLPLIAAIPYDNQPEHWALPHIQLWSQIKSQASQVINLHPGPYATWKLHRRNAWMVANADALIALFDGHESGTSSTIKLAHKFGVPVHNQWPQFIKEFGKPQ